MTVYIARNKVNGKNYVGKTVQPLGYRWATHKREARKGSRHFFHRAIRKYGADNFEIRPVYHDKQGIVTEDYLFLWETSLILLTRSNEPEFGYNMTLGGEGTRGLKNGPPSEETRRKIKQDAHRAEVWIT